MNHTDRKILQIAVPSVISNITVPLLGLVDVAIVGHLGSPAYLATIAIGTMIFNIIYWIFGFLRMGTSGMTSQALGRRDLQEVTDLLVRSGTIALLLSALLLLLQSPIEYASLLVVDASDTVRTEVSAYFRICIWGAPAVLGLWSLSGWFIGMQNTRIPMTIALVQNLVNIICSLVLVYVFDLKIEGVALGTLIAQYSGFLLALIFWHKYYGRLIRRIDFRCLSQYKAMKRFFQVNRDIFLRTICLVLVTVFFTSAGSRQGEVILGVNTLMMQFFTIFSYIMDGFAFAGEALTGRYTGARNFSALRDTIKRLFIWGGITAVLFALAYGVGGNLFLQLLTGEASVIEAAQDYYGWIVVIPLSGFMAFLMDGIIIGATRTRLMLKAMLVASFMFFVLYLAFERSLHNHALWLAFSVYLLFRGIMELYWGRSIWQNP